MASVTYSREELNRLLRIDHLSEVVRRRKVRQLVASHKFPRPLPGLSDTWSAILVDAWIGSAAAASFQPPSQEAAAEADDDTATIIEIRRQLEERIAQR